MKIMFCVPISGCEGLPTEKFPEANVAGNHNASTSNTTMQDNFTHIHINFTVRNNTSTTPMIMTSTPKPHKSTKGKKVAIIVSCTLSIPAVVILCCVCKAFIQSRLRTHPLDEQRRKKQKKGVGRKGRKHIPKGPLTVSLVDTGMIPSSYSSTYYMSM